MWTAFLIVYIYFDKADLKSFSCNVKRILYLYGLKYITNYLTKVK